MRTLIVGVGALGGVIAARLRAAGAPVSLAVRDAEAASQLKAAGLQVAGVGGEVAVDAGEVAPLEAYLGGRSFELIVLATKARDALEAAPRLRSLLGAEGVLLPIQNGGVAQLVAEQLGMERVLGGLSNLGATMVRRGLFEQRNAGHLLVGELAGGVSPRAEHVRAWLGQGIEVRVTGNLRGAIWSKLLLNCSVTTIGALAGCTMRTYVRTSEGRALFERAYGEALAVALASGARPERMLVDPIPPEDHAGPSYEAWLEQVLQSYGDLKPSMLQDFERGRPTEVDFINGYVVDLGRKLGVDAPVNAAIVERVHAISRGSLKPGPGVLEELARAVGLGSP